MQVLDGPDGQALMYLNRRVLKRRVGSWRGPLRPIVVIVCRYWPTGEERLLYVSDGWSERQWRQYACQLGLVPLYKVTAKDKRYA